ncbi:MAG: hypothetical protein LBR73_05220 [Oscillospiraceae bacterium]|nr:hypothetical protein [Oscillospiraceae bacterium]
MVRRILALLLIALLGWGAFSCSVGDAGGDSPGITADDGAPVTSAPAREPAAVQYSLPSAQGGPMLYPTYIMDTVGSGTSVEYIWRIALINERAEGITKPELQTLYYHYDDAGKISCAVAGDFNHQFYLYALDGSRKQITDGFALYGGDLKGDYRIVRRATVTDELVENEDTESIHQLNILDYKTGKVLLPYGDKVGQRNVSAMGENTFLLEEIDADWNVTKREVFHADTGKTEPMTLPYLVDDKLYNAAGQVQLRVFSLGQSFYFSAQKARYCLITENALLGTNRFQLLDEKGNVLLERSGAGLDYLRAACGVFVYSVNHNTPVVLYDWDGTQLWTDPEAFYASTTWQEPLLCNTFGGGYYLYGGLDSGTDYLIDIGPVRVSQWEDTSGKCWYFTDAAKPLAALPQVESVYHTEYDADWNARFVFDENEEILKDFNFWTMYDRFSFYPRCVQLPDLYWVTRGNYQGYIDKNGTWHYKESRWQMLDD